MKLNGRQGLRRKKGHAHVPELRAPRRFMDDSSAAKPFSALESLSFLMLRVLGDVGGRLSKMALHFQRGGRLAFLVFRY